MTIGKILRNQRGMTLLEIIIVVTIVAALAAVLGTTVQTQRRKAQVKQAKIQMAELSKSLEMYYTDCGSYPNDLNALLEGDSACPNWGPEPYAKKNQLLDPWNNPFGYYLENGQFTIVSYGEDKKEGGTSYAKDILSTE